MTTIAPRLGFGLASIDTGMTDQHGLATALGRALGALPLRSGPPHPYPFPRKAG